MKLKSLIAFGLAAIFIFLFVSCFKDENKEYEPPVYSFAEDIIYPPDEFRILYNLKNIGNFSARVKFDTNMVWKISKGSSPSSLFWVERKYPDSTATMIIDDKIVVGLEGEIIYEFIGNNNNYPHERDILLTFEKLPYDYESYPVKF